MEQARSAENAAAALELISNGPASAAARFNGKPQAV
jgi:hypothetical protein